MTVFDNPNFKNIQAVDPDSTNSLFLLDVLKTFREECLKGIYWMTVPDFLFYLDSNGIYMDSIVHSPDGTPLGTVADFLRRVGSMYGLNAHFLDGIEKSVAAQREMFSVMKKHGKDFDTAALDDMELPFYYMVRAYLAVYNKLPESADVSAYETIDCDDGDIIPAVDFYNGLIDSNLIEYKRRGYSWRVFHYIRKKGHVSFKDLAEHFAGCELSYLIELYMLYDSYAYQCGGSLLLSAEVNNYLRALSVAYRVRFRPPLDGAYFRQYSIVFDFSSEVDES